MLTNTQFAARRHRALATIVLSVKPSAASSDWRSNHSLAEVGSTVPKEDVGQQARATA